MTQIICYMFNHDILVVSMLSRHKETWLVSMSFNGMFLSAFNVVGVFFNFSGDGLCWSNYAVIHVISCLRNITSSVQTCTSPQYSRILMFYCWYIVNADYVLL